jgi:hypothetical protein
VADTTALCHHVTVHVAAPAERALAFMSDGLKLGTWAMGCWNTRAASLDLGPDLFVGTSLFDGSEGYVRIVVDRALMNVDYHVGPAPDRLAHMNTARVIPGATLGRDPQSCVVTLLAWRPASMSDAAWQRICVTHEAEMLLIQSWLGGNAL